MQEATLHLYGQARLENRGNPVSLGKKSLAILYYLAIEGPTPRRRLARLLWNHNAALQNLRVELAKIRRALDDPYWARGDDVLVLPARVRLEEDGEGLPLESLENLEVPWDSWLGALRSRLFAAQPYGFLEDLPEPSLLIIEAPTGADVSTLIHRIAAARGLEIRKTPPQRQRALYLLQREVDIEACLDCGGLLVYVRSHFGEDPKSLLTLRASYPPKRTRYVHYPRLTFEEAKNRAEHMSFSEQARFFLATGGVERHFAEAVGSGRPYPRSLVASYHLEARRLSHPARSCLERLAIHPGPIGDWLVDAVEAEDHLDELIVRRWLKMSPEGLRFSDPVARRALASGLPQDLKTRLHRRIAQAARNQGEGLAEAYHRISGGLPLEGTSLPKLDLWAELSLKAFRGQKPDQRHAPAPEPLEVGAEMLSPEPIARGPGTEIGRRGIWFIRDLHQSEPSQVHLEAFENEPVVLRLRLNAYLENPLYVGLDGQSLPLELSAGHTRVHFAPVTGPYREGNILVLPLGNGDYWFDLAPDLPLTLQSRAAAGVIGVELSFHRVTSRVLTRESAAPRVTGWRIGSDAKTPRGSWHRS